MPQQAWVDLLGKEWWKSAEKLANFCCGPNANPSRELVFAAFDEVQPRDVNVVILGQDCYPHPGKARGVAFGYHPGYSGPINSSMANIILEAGGSPETFDRSLSKWTAQGVLLLNTRLTVQHNKPMSHAGLGWEPLMQEALHRICKYAQPVVLAWGSEARKMAHKSPAWNIVDTSHPCRYSASRGNKPFLGSKCFQRVNELLVLQGDKPISWAGE